MPAVTGCGSEPSFPLEAEAEDSKTVDCLSAAFPGADTHPASSSVQIGDQDPGQCYWDPTALPLSTFLRELLMATELPEARIPNSALTFLLFS